MKNLQANIREATIVLQEERVGEGEGDGRTKDKEENEAISKGKKQLEVLWIGDMLIMPTMIIRMALIDYDELLIKVKIVIDNRHI